MLMNQQVSLARVHIPSFILGIMLVAMLVR
jgi:hypothetical protein